MYPNVSGHHLAPDRSGKVLTHTHLAAAPDRSGKVLLT